MGSEEGAGRPCFHGTRLGARPLLFPKGTPPRPGHVARVSPGQDAGAHAGRPVVASPGCSPLSDEDADATGSELKSPRTLLCAGSVLGLGA